MCTSDACTFIMNPGHEDMVVIILYVDDILIASKNYSLIQQIKNMINSRFASQFLLWWRRIRSTKKRSRVHVAICTRPDIAFAISYLARFQDRMNLQVTQAIIHLFKFLFNTKDQWLVFTGDYISLEGFSDSDWAGDNLTRKSTTGFVIFLGNGLFIGNPNYRISSLCLPLKQSIIYCTFNHLSGSYLDQDASSWMGITLYCDNQGAIQLTIQHSQRKRTRHVDIKYHHIRDLNDKGEIIISKIHTSNMIADILTKNTSTNTFNSLKGSLIGDGIILPCKERIQKFKEIQSVTSFRGEGYWLSDSTLFQPASSGCVSP